MVLNFAHDEIRVKRIFADGLWNIDYGYQTMPSMIHRLGEILKTRGMKKALADAIGTSPSVISDLCAGNDRLNDDLIERICKALGMPAWCLFVDPDKVYPLEDKKIVEAYRKLRGAKKLAVDEFMGLNAGFSFSGKPE